MANAPAIELEVKFCNVDLEVLRQKLKDTKAVLKTPDRLMRRMVFGGEANPTMVCTYGRVRDEGNVITMSAKYSAQNGKISSQKEAMVVVDSFENAVTILESFGLQMTDYQENRRETWMYEDGTLVELETWPDLPTYIEIEGPSVEAIRQAAERLALVWEEHTTDSTDKLYQRHYALSDEKVRQKLANLRFTVAQ